MSEENKKSEGPDLGDWSPDHFPKSPYGVFKKSILLIALIALLCLVVRWCSMNDQSDHTSQSKSINTNEDEETGLSPKENIFGDEDKDSE
ncbi:MAG TPA: hypothetical protein PKA63_12795 [Oligoflexia bacterium]|nr:hypothetical protein [Oligoflexia bacterium]HMP49536.1 hypothetical protein [Oligoflexia bacterium]